MVAPMCGLRRVGTRRRVFVWNGGSQHDGWNNCWTRGRNRRLQSNQNSAGHPQMTDLDIWRAANILLKRYTGEAANPKAAQARLRGKTSACREA